MAQYPTMDIPNSYEILGKAVSGFNEYLTEDQKRQQQLREAMQAMTERRAAAILAQQESTLRQQALQEEAQRKRDEEQRAADFALEAAKGKVISPTLEKNPELARRPPASEIDQGPTQDEMAWLEDTAGRTSAPQSVRSGPSPTRMMGEALDALPTEGDNGRLPRNRQELADLALQKRQLKPNEYFSATKPERDRFQVIETGGRKVRINLDTGEEMDLGPATGRPGRFIVKIMNGRQVKINLDTNEQTDLGPAEPKPEAPKDLQPTEIKELSGLAAKRDNVHYMVDGFQDSFTGPGTWSQNQLGRVIGTTPDQVRWWQDYSAFVNQIRNATFGASLTPGEKREFEKTIVTETMNPAIARSNLERQRKIVDDAVERQKKIYSAGRRVNNAQVEAALGSPESPAPTATPNAGPSLPSRGRFKPLDAATAGEYLKRAGYTGPGPSTPEQRKKAKAMLAKDGYNVGG